MSKKRGNKKGKNADDDFEDTQSLSSEKDLTSKPAKGKPPKKGKKGKKDDWSDDEINEDSE